LQQAVNYFGDTIVVVAVVVFQQDVCDMSFEDHFKEMLSRGLSVLPSLGTKNNRYIGCRFKKMAKTTRGS
jgi:hypothetical protein